MKRQVYSDKTAVKSNSAATKGGAICWQLDVTMAVMN